MTKHEALSLLAMKRVLTTKLLAEARTMVTPGVTESLDITVRLQGQVKVGLAYDQRQPAKADPWTLLTVALSKLNGVTLESLTREAVALDHVDLLVKPLKKRAAEAIQAIKDSTNARCNGKLTGTVAGSVTKGFSTEAEKAA